MPDDINDLEKKFKEAGIEPYQEEALSPQSKTPLQYSFEREGISPFDDPYSKASSAVRGFFETPAESQAVTVPERMAIQNIIHDRPDLQEKYLKEKGYETQRDVHGRVWARKLGQDWGVVDPAGFDIQDVTDVLGETIEMVAGGLGTAAAGPLGMAAAGTAAGAGVEAARQGLGVALGMRPEVEPEKIAESGFYGGLGGLGGGVLAKTAGRATKPFTPELKSAEEIAGIKEAAESMGTKPIASQLFKDPAIARREQILTQAGGTLGGMRTRAKVDAAAKNADEELKALFQDALDLKPGEVAARVHTEVSDNLRPQLAFAEEIYERYTDVMPEIPVNMLELEDTLGLMMEDQIGSEAAEKAIRTQAQYLKKITNLKQLNNYRKTIRDKAENMLTIDPGERHVLRQIYKNANNIRRNTLKQYASTLPGGEEMVKELAEADAAYAETARRVRTSVLAPKAKTKLSPGAAVDQAFEGNPIAAMNRMFQAGNYKRLKRVQQDFPEAFDVFRRAKLGEMEARASKDALMSPQAVIRIFEKMGDVEKDLILGKYAKQKIEFMKTYYDSFHRIYNPSGTAGSIRQAQMWNPWHQLSRIGDSLFLKAMTNPAIRNKLLRNIFGGGTAYEVTKQPFEEVDAYSGAKAGAQDIMRKIGEYIKNNPYIMGR